jgi:hypothetical protein
MADGSRLLSMIDIRWILIFTGTIGDPPSTSCRGHAKSDLAVVSAPTTGLVSVR